MRNIRLTRPLAAAGAVLLFVAAFNSATVAWVHGIGAGIYTSLTVGAGGTGAASITQSGTGNFLFTLGGPSSILNFRSDAGVSVMQLTASGLAMQKPITFPSTLVVSGAGNSGNSAILLNKAASGTWTGTGILTLGTIHSFTDTVVAASAEAVEALNLNINTGGVAKGNRHTAEFDFKLTSTSANSTGTGATYSALNTKCQLQASDNGTGLTTATSKGFCYGFNPVSGADAGAINLRSIVGDETDVYVEAGASVMDKIGIQIVQITPDAVQGTRDDVALSITNAVGAAGWANLLEFGRYGGNDPCAATCTLIYGTGNQGTAMNATKGVDFTNVVFATSAFASTGFSVDPDGDTAVKTLKTATVYSVAGTALPTCNGGAEGTRAVVSDANSTTFHATYTGSSTNHMPVTCDGTNWVIG